MSHTNLYKEDLLVLRSHFNQWLKNYEKVWDRQVQHTRMLQKMECWHCHQVTFFPGIDYSLQIMENICLLFQLS